jgi:hypothetical protein
MVDEAAYRRTREQAVGLPCVFQGALLARCASCELGAKRALAEREVLTCTRPTAHLNCETLERLFHERATFALRLHPRAPLTHATELRLQSGGLSGLQQVLAAPVADVHRMVQQAQADYGSLTELPWEQVVQSIVAWQPRRRTGPKPTS